MKKTKKIIGFCVICIVAVVAAVGGFYIIKEINLKKSIANLDKKYENLSDFKLESPFDLSVLNTYEIRDLSTEEHIAIDFFGKPGVEKIPFLAMIDGIVTKVEAHKMQNQEGNFNWAFQIVININSQYRINFNFETFKDTDEIKKLQKQNLFVKEGDHIKQGAIIGNLIISDSNSAHVHFNIERINSYEHIVPEPYFSETAMNLINEVYINS